MAEREAKHGSFQAGAPRCLQGSGWAVSRSRTAVSPGERGLHMRRDTDESPVYPPPTTPQATSRAPPPPAGGESSWPIRAAETSPRCFPSHVIMFRSQLQCRAFHVILHQRPLAPRSQTFLRVSAFLPLPPRQRVCRACSPAGVCSSVNDLYPSNVASLLFPKQTFNVKVVSDFLRSF